MTVPETGPAAAPHARDVAPLTRREFELVAGLARRSCGLELPESKRLMVWSRLARNVREMECRNFSEYYRRVLEDESGEALCAMIDRLTTSFTGFMREPVHFDFLRKVVVPRFCNAPQIRVWSAGAATGEEAYSIAISLLEAFPEARPPVISILATDISRNALRKASRGIYLASRLRSLDPVLLAKYFLKGSGRVRGWYRIKPEIRNLVSFRRLNLIDRFPSIGSFPVIFCRNVMIYFDRETQLATVGRLTDCLEPGGHLLIGHSETLAGADSPLEYVRPAVYRKREAKARQPWPRMR